APRSKRPAPTGRRWSSIPRSPAGWAAYSAALRARLRRASWAAYSAALRARLRRARGLRPEGAIGLPVFFEVVAGVAVPNETLRVRFAGAHTVRHQRSNELGMNPGQPDAVPHHLAGSHGPGPP